MTLVTMLADAANPSVNTMWIALIAGGSVLSNLATIGLFLVALRKTRAEVTFGFEPASKKEFEKHVEDSQKETLAIFREINRIKSENLQMTKDIGQITNQTLAALANAQKVLHT